MKVSMGSDGVSVRPACTVFLGRFLVKSPMSPEGKSISITTIFVHFLVNSESDLRRVPTDRELLDVSLHIFSNWKFIALYLDVGKDAIDAISEDTKGNVKEQAYQMLSTWKERQGETASINNLCKALVAMGQKGTAEKVFRYT